MKTKSEISESCGKGGTAGPACAVGIVGAASACRSAAIQLMQETQQVREKMKHNGIQEHLGFEDVLLVGAAHAVLSGVSRAKHVVDGMGWGEMGWGVEWGSLGQDATLARPRTASASTSERRLSPSAGFSRMTVLTATVNASSMACSARYALSCAITALRSPGRPPLDHQYYSEHGLITKHGLITP